GVPYPNSDYARWLRLRGRRGEFRDIPMHGGVVGRVGRGGDLRRRRGGDRDGGCRGHDLLQVREIRVDIRRMLRRIDAGQVIRARGFLHDRWRYRLESPDETRPRQGLEAVVRDVDLPPIEPVSGARHVTVMVVVP